MIHAQPSLDFEAVGHWNDGGATALVACEESQVMTKLLRDRGIEAFSCDLLETSGDRPDWHFQMDVRHLLEQSWDLIVAFPPCDHLARSGGHKWAEKKADGRQQQGIDLFLDIWRADCPRIAIENPIGYMNTNFRKPDQIIEPWQHGHGETKATCLWLKGLPRLYSTDVVAGREHNIVRMGPSANRRILRSKTFPGIATAMAEQWT